MKVVPKYLPRPSEDLGLFDLLAPETDYDLGWSSDHYLGILAQVPWRVSPKQRAILWRVMCREWQSSVAVKRDLLGEALPRVWLAMRERQRVRFGVQWMKDDAGKVRPVRPAKDWGHITAPGMDGRYCLIPRPTAADVDRFAAWFENKLLREGRRGLDERADILEDEWQWERGSEPEDRLTGAIKLPDAAEAILAVAPEDESPLLVPHAGDRHQALIRAYGAALEELRRLVVEREHLKALLDVLASIHSGEPAWSRNHTLRRDRLGMNLRRMRIDHPECFDHVHLAWQAADELGAAGVPLPELT